MIRTAAQQTAFLALALTLAASKARADASSATFSLNNLPNTWQQGQSGTNQCSQWLPSNQNSLCQNVFINSATDFCLWAPRSPGTIGDTERDEVAWCTSAGYGTRLIPEGTLKSVHFVKTKAYVQVTGTGDFTKMNIVAGDDGGELDPHGADGNGNPIGGLVYTNAFGGQYQQIHQWTNFMSANEYCFKACIDAPDAETQCNHIFDLQGCFWNMPANYGDGFEQCQGDVAQYPGVYGSSTYYQGPDGENPAPPPHPAPASYNCSPEPSPGNGLTAPAPSSPATRSGSGSAASSSAAAAVSASLAASASAAAAASASSASALAALSSTTSASNTVSTAPAVTSVIPVVIPPQQGFSTSTLFVSAAVSTTTTASGSRSGVKTGAAPEGLLQARTSVLSACLAGAVAVYALVA
ncbi:hypothetical protein OC842_005997 [Tilletia horrida]|uniref:Carbohydrate-binding module family 13 protein n=1 Tax=Tilletia horrida TaxID=155126 RepID=A0AAN6G8R3_9BASI|nr:hypothetical protein OC842_005997 [Tilletia horrida]